MSINVTYNGNVYTIPQSPNVGWGDQLTTYLVALSSGALTKSAGLFTLIADLNLGANYGILSKYFTSITANPSTAGILRLSVTDSIGFRNNANSNNLLLGINASDLLTFNGTALQPSGNYITSLTGDVVASGAGAAAAVIQPGVVTNAMLAGGITYSNLILTGAILNSDLAGGIANAKTTADSANTPSAIVARDGSGNFAAGIITAALIGNVTGNLTGNVTGNTSGSAASFTGTLVGDVGGTQGATLIGANVVTNAKAAQMAAHTFKGNITGSTANATDLTAAQLTAALNLFNTSLQGLVPPSGGSSAEYLSADGTFSTPTGTGIGTVTTVSVVSINGLAGTVANPTSTPAISLSTTITGLLKGNGTAISAAAAADITGQLITGYTSGAGTVAATDSILQAINKLNGNALLLAPIASPTFTGTVTAPTFVGALTGTATNFSGSLVGDVTGTQGATAIAAATVTGKLITGYTSGAGTVAATDSILQAINKLNGNDGLKAPLASPAFTGAPTLINASGNSIFQITASTATALAISSYTSGSVNGIVGINGTGAGGIFGGAAANAMVIGHQGAFPMQLATNNTVRMSIDSSGNTTCSGNLAFTTQTTQGIVGTIVTGNAAAGNVGEYISARRANDGSLTLTNNTGVNITSITLTAGDWDISAIANVGVFTAGTLVMTYWLGGIGTTSGAGLTEGDSFCFSGQFPTGQTDCGIAIPAYRVSITTSTTYFLVVQAGFSGTAVVDAFGRISARRIR